MEASSPLAALHRPMPVPGWGSRDVFRGHPHYSTASVTSATMSLREQLHKTADYFNVKDVRGSSPAASLAADLSQNFRLDNDSRFVAPVPGTRGQVSLVNITTSPQFPTPRRALFTAGMMGGMEGRGEKLNGSIPSSWGPRLLTGYLPGSSHDSSVALLVARAPDRAHGGFASTSQGTLLHTV